MFRKLNRTQWRDMLLRVLGSETANLESRLVMRHKRGPSPTSLRAGGFHDPELRCFFLKPKGPGMEVMVFSGLIPAFPRTYVVEIEEEAFSDATAPGGLSKKPVPASLNQTNT